MEDFHVIYQFFRIFRGVYLRKKKTIRFYTTDMAKTILDKIEV